MITIFIFGYKIAKKKMHLSSYKGLKKSTIKFKTFDTTFISNFQVQRQKEYILEYDLATEAGKVSVEIDRNFYIETTDQAKGTTTIMFNRFQPGISFVGDHAKNGHASARLYEKK